MMDSRPTRPTCSRASAVTGAGSMAFGVVTLLAGVAVLAWPGRTLVVIAVLFGVQLIVTGIFRFVAAFAATI